jgi:hypothetical protein
MTVGLKRYDQEPLAGLIGPRQMNDVCAVPPAAGEALQLICVGSTMAAALANLSSSGASPTQPANPPTPTTRILAIGTINSGVDPEAVRSILPTEVRETVKLYLDGTIDQWFSLQGRNGVAFILNVTDPAAARAMLEKLPLGRAHLMSFELIPLAPLNPLRQLMGTAPTPP